MFYCHTFWFRQSSLTSPSCSKLLVKWEERGKFFSFSASSSFSFSFFFLFPLFDVFTILGFYCVFHSVRFIHFAISHSANLLSILFFISSSFLYNFAIQKRKSEIVTNVSVKIDWPNCMNFGFCLLLCLYFGIKMTNDVQMFNEFTICKLLLTMAVSTWIITKIFRTHTHSIQMEQPSGRRKKTATLITKANRFSIA